MHPCVPAIVTKTPVTKQVDCIEGVFLARAHRVRHQIVYQGPLKGGKRHPVGNPSPTYSVEGCLWLTERRKRLSSRHLTGGVESIECRRCRPTSRRTPQCLSYCPSCRLQPILPAWFVGRIVGNFDLRG